MSQVRNPIILRTATRQSWPAAAPFLLRPIGKVWQPAIGHRALTLAQAILARCLPFTPRLSGLSPIYRQEPLSVLTQYAQNYRQDIFAPQLKLTLIAAASSTPVTPASNDTHTDSHFTWQVLRPVVVAPASERLVYRLIQREQVETHAFGETIHRLITRSQRLETVTTPGRSTVQDNSAINLVAAATPTVAPMLPSQVMARPVPRVVHRPANHQTVTEPDPIAAASSRWQPFTPIGSRPQPQPTPSETIDVNRLTEQIMYNIDRRINAYRERTGRM